jgi:hypothetical protein
VRWYPRRWRVRVPASVRLVVTGGCHDTAFFATQTPASLAFLAAHIA